MQKRKQDQMLKLIKECNSELSKLYNASDKAWDKGNMKAVRVLEAKQRPLEKFLERVHNLSR